MPTSELITSCPPESIPAIDNGTSVPAKINANSTAQAAQKVRLSCPSTEVLLFVLPPGHPQLSIVVSDTAMERIKFICGRNGPDNRQLLGMLSKVIPALPAEIAGVVEKSMVYPYLKTKGERKKHLVAAACCVKRLLSAEENDSRSVNLTLEVCNSDFSESVCGRAPRSPMLVKLLDDLKAMGRVYEQRRAVNPKLIEVDFVPIVQQINNVFEMYANGSKLRPIAFALKLSYACVKNWLSGNLVIPQMDRSAIESMRRPKVHALDLSPLTDLERAYLFGGFLACHAGRERIVSHVGLTSNEDAVKKIAQLFERVIPSTSAAPEVSKTKNSWCCNVRSRHFLELMEYETQGGNLIPYERFPSLEARLEFLRGYFAFRHQLKGDGLIIRKAEKPSLIIELANLLCEHGVVPKINGKPPRELLIMDRLGVQQVVNLKLISIPTEVARLERILSRGSSQKFYSADQYAAALRFKATPGHQGATLSQMSKELGIPEVTLHSWRAGTAKPRVVRHAEELSQLRKKWNVPDPEVYVRLVNEFGLAPKSSREVACTLKSLDLDARRELLASFGLDILANPETFQLPIIVLEEACLFYGREVRKIPESEIPIQPFRSAEEKHRRWTIVADFARTIGLEDKNISGKLQSICRMFLGSKVGKMP